MIIDQFVSVKISSEWNLNIIFFVCDKFLNDDRKM